MLSFVKTYKSGGLDHKLASEKGPLSRFCLKSSFPVNGIRLLRLLHTFDLIKIGFIVNLPGHYSLCKLLTNIKQLF